MYTRTPNCVYTTTAECRAADTPVSKLSEIGECVRMKTAKQNQCRTVDTQ